MLPRRTRPRPPRRRLYVGFAVDGRRWVLPAEAIAAVGVLGPVTRLPTADPARLGVAVHRGRVVALLGTGGVDRSPPPATRHLIVLRAGDGDVGLPVDELVGLEVAYGDAVPAGFELLAVPAVGAAAAPGGRDGG